MENMALISINRIVSFVVRMQNAIKHSKLFVLGQLANVYERFAFIQSFMVVRLVSREIGNATCSAPLWALHTAKTNNTQ